MVCSGCTYRFDMGSWNNKLLPLAAQYLQFLGTDKYSAEEISKQFYNLACNFNVIAGNEETTVTISGLQENFDKAVALFEDVINNCKPDEAALDGLKNSIAKARANNKLKQAGHCCCTKKLCYLWCKQPVQFCIDQMMKLKI